MIFSIQMIIFSAFKFLIKMNCSNKNFCNYSAAFLTPPAGGLSSQSICFSLFLPEIVDWLFSLRLLRSLRWIITIFYLKQN